MYQRYVYNRAVNAANKGDQFVGDSEDPYVESLVGAGYANPVMSQPLNPDGTDMFSDLDEDPEGF